MEKFATKVKEGPIFYDPPPFCTLELKEKLETSHLKVYMLTEYEPEHGSFLVCFGGPKKGSILFHSLMLLF